MSALTAAMEKVKQEEEEKTRAAGAQGSSDNNQAQGTKDLGIPTMDQCNKIMAEQGMKPNIMEHSQKVAYVARNILGFLKADNPIDGCLVAAGALLHDIAKTRCLETHERHDVVGGEMITALGYPQLAVIVREHVNIESFTPDGPLTPQEIVCYADKRVMHTEIVSLVGRKIDIFARYGGRSPEQAEMIEANFARYTELENKIKRSITCELSHIIPDNSVDVTLKWEYGGSEVRIAGNFTSWIPRAMPNKEFHTRLPPVKNTQQQSHCNFTFFFDIGSACVQIYC